MTLSLGSSVGSAPLGRPSRAFCLTINNWSVQQLTVFRELDGVLHAVVGSEVSASGTPHLQAYLRMKRPYRISTIKKWFPTAHIEVAKSFDAAANYCRKENIELTIDNRVGKGKRTDLDEYAKQIPLMSDRDIYDAHPGSYMRYSQHHFRIRSLFGGGVREPPVVTWLWGSTGSGKTRAAYEQHPDLYACPPGKLQWFDGYFGQECALLDDLRAPDLPFAFLLRLLDRYPLQVPIKGGFTRWMPKVIIITAPKPPEELFADHIADEDLAQLTRRIDTIKHIVKP